MPFGGKEPPYLHRTMLDSEMHGKKRVKKEPVLKPAPLCLARFSPRVNRVRNFHSPACYALGVHIRIGQQRLFAELAVVVAAEGREELQHVDRIVEVAQPAMAANVKVAGLALVHLASGLVRRARFA